MYEKIRMNGRVVSMAVMIVAGVDRLGIREILTVEPMHEECDLQTSAGPRLEEGLACDLRYPCRVESSGHRMFWGLHLATLLRSFHEEHPGSCRPQ